MASDAREAVTQIGLSSEAALTSCMAPMADMASISDSLLVSPTLYEKNVANRPRGDERHALEEAITLDDGRIQHDQVAIDPAAVEEAIKDISDHLMATEIHGLSRPLLAGLAEDVGAEVLTAYDPLALFIKLSDQRPIQPGLRAQGFPEVADGRAATLGVRGLVNGAECREVRSKGFHAHRLPNSNALSIPFGTLPIGKGKSGHDV